MPLYEYQCQACGKKFEVIQKFSDAPLAVHPECGGPAEKLISAPAFHLKGTGWYATDYAKSNGSPASKTGDDSKPAADTSSASPATESKPGASETKAKDTQAKETKAKSDSTPAPTPTPSAS
jgi:putative FmdB family regulatory protein